LAVDLSGFEIVIEINLQFYDDFVGWYECL